MNSVHIHVQWSRKKVDALEGAINISKDASKTPTYIAKKHTHYTFLGQNGKYSVQN